MTQNTSTAVMARRAEAPDSLDYFPTPPWASRALVEHVLIGHGWGAHELRDMTCWEPACGEGYMARPLSEYFGSVHASDCHDYGAAVQARVCDFLFPGSEPPHFRRRGPDFVITNPPFRLAREFIERGLDVAREGVAVLVRAAFIEGCERYRTLFSGRPPALLAPFAERVPMIKGRIDEKASSATAYVWLVWSKRNRMAGTRVVWIPPCRKALERPGDYREPEPAA